MSIPSDYILDTSGLCCPEPLMLLHQRIRTMRAGEVVQVVATDPSTTRDIPKFCEFLNHPLIEQLESDQTFLYSIKKGQ